MTFCLTTTIVKPEMDIPIKNAVILLHGYGGDGKDISMLALNWKRFLPNTIFLCPNGPEKCPINPSGYQWFDLTKDDPQYILEESKKAEKKLQQYIGELKIKYDLKSSQVCLSGFSQGCMMSINLGLTSFENYNCIVGFSGKIINKEDLSKRITSPPSARNTAECVCTQRVCVGPCRQRYSSPLRPSFRGAGHVHARAIVHFIILIDTLAIER